MEISTPTKWIKYKDYKTTNWAEYEWEVNITLPPTRSVKSPAGINIGMGDLLNANKTQPKVTTGFECKDVPYVIINKIVNKVKLKTKIV